MVNVSLAFQKVPSPPTPTCRQTLREGRKYRLQSTHPLNRQPLSALKCLRKSLGRHHATRVKLKLYTCVHFTAKLKLRKETTEKIEASSWELPRYTYLYLVSGFTDLVYVVGSAGLTFKVLSLSEGRLLLDGWARSSVCCCLGLWGRGDAD